jgi:hypothetical protein
MIRSMSRSPVSQTDRFPDAAVFFLVNEDLVPSSHRNNSPASGKRVRGFCVLRHRSISWLSICRYVRNKPLVEGDLLHLPGSISYIHLQAVDF